MVDIPRTHGALLLGGFFAAGLSGFVAVQSVLYFKLYNRDPTKLKVLVLLMWLLDLAHTAFTWAAIWDYVIENFGKTPEIDTIPLALALTIVFTAILTFMVHCFFAHRIFLLSKKNYFVTVPIVIFAIARLSSACATSAEMIRSGSFSLFKARFRWLFSLGLALSTITDIMVTLSLLYLLRSSKSRSMSLNHIIDSLILYTLEIGSLTCAGTIVSMICWLAMNDNLIFMGLHFVIAKLYANSLLATMFSLNSRHTLRNAQSISNEVIQASDLEYSRRRETLRFNAPLTDDSTSAIRLQHVQISVEKNIHFEYETER